MVKEKQEQGNAKNKTNTKKKPIMDPALEFRKIWPHIPFGPNAPIDPQSIFYEYQALSHPVIQASYQLGKGLLEYLKIPFSGADRGEKFGLLSLNHERIFYLVCPVFFNFSYPAPKGFAYADWKEITKGLAGLTTAAYVNLDIISTDCLQRSRKDVPKNMVPRPNCGIDRFVPTHLIDVWYRNGHRSKGPDISIDLNRQVDLMAFPKKLTLDDIFFSPTTEQTSWRKEFERTNNNCQTIIDLYNQGLQTSQPKLIEVVKRKILDLMANHPDFEHANLEIIEKYRSQIKRYEKIGEQIEGPYLE